MLGFRFLGVRAACKGRCHGPACVDTQCSWPLQAKTGGSSWTLMEVFAVRIIKGDIQEFRQWLTWNLGLLRRRVQREQLSTITRRSPGFVGGKGESAVHAIKMLSSRHNLLQLFVLERRDPRLPRLIFWVFCSTRNYGSLLQLG